MQLGRRDEGAAAILLSSDQAAADPFIQRRATDAQDARGFRDFKAKMRKGIGNGCHETPRYQCESDRNRSYPSASTR